VNKGGAAHLEALERLVGEELVRELNDGDGTLPVLEERLVSGLERLVVRVEDDGQAEKEAVLELHLLDDVGVGGLVHEAGEGGEAAVHEKFHVAELAGGELDRVLDVGGDGGVGGGVGHQVDERAAVGRGEEAAEVGCEWMKGVAGTGVAGAGVAGPGQAVSGVQGQGSEYHGSTIASSTMASSTMASSTMASSTRAMNTMAMNTMAMNTMAMNTTAMHTMALVPGQISWLCKFENLRQGDLLGSDGGHGQLGSGVGGGECGRERSGSGDRECG